MGYTIHFKSVKTNSLSHKISTSILFNFYTKAIFIFSL
ncbi:hypothetical protein J769_3389 [Acinetobacter baumannii 25307_6]|uniref:Uncharacterized protein n=2 Tax=Acinetobacter baumannii TaxID=470 RepID=A0ABC9V631_ACIBA|nr:hypothetical protein BJAB0868_01592 [Acinetobacter baumannii BJAB0868]AGQ14650.1 hypothetical protein BJAB07104_02282 [Acinetobacter baumannii BJAB07104]ETQ25480.1 hypothetical protein P652_0770 [Acinetobacter baumannii UH14508]ETQ29849.1 hypothetical protein P653_2650 [Acinetobacter baumannii UH15208]ETQ32998.1 hypothetical protein P654_3385 [Acinetobacter baumannii UH16008]ETQ60098.1 hypothetical protein P660_3461 [Acinetobacter baumannii UH20108]ETQ88102.1 hypothetical protein P669_3952